MVRRSLAALALAAVACTANPSPTHVLPMISKHVIGSAFYQTQSAWDNSPWHKPGDRYVDHPIFLVIADDWTACVVSDAEWALNRDYAACPADEWRPQQHSL